MTWQQLQNQVETRRVMCKQVIGRKNKTLAFQCHNYFMQGLNVLWDVPLNETIADEAAREDTKRPHSYIVIDHVKIIQFKVDVIIPHLEFSPNVRQCFCVVNLLNFAAAVPEPETLVAPWGCNAWASGSWAVSFNLTIEWALPWAPLSCLILVWPRPEFLRKCYTIA